MTDQPDNVTDFRRTNSETLIDARWVCRIENSRFFEKTVGNVRPTKAQKDLAKRLIQYLNRELSMYRWMVSWSEPEMQPLAIETGMVVPHVPRLLTMMPIDEDGDTHFIVEAERYYQDWLDADLVGLAGLCAAAIIAYQRTEEAADVRPDQKIKYAQGQRSIH